MQGKVVNTNKDDQKKKINSWGGEMGLWYISINSSYLHIHPIVVGCTSQQSTVFKFTYLTRLWLIIDFRWVSRLGTFKI